MNFLCEEATTSATQWILPAVLLVLVIGIFILNYFKSKKSQENMQNMVNSLKVGDNVKTYSGIYGKIIEIVETTDGKVAVLETGSENNKGIFSIDINAIYGIDEKKPVVYDVDGNIISDEPEQEATEAEKAEEKVEEVVPVAVEEKPKKRKKKAKKEPEVEQQPQVEVSDEGIEAQAAQPEEERKV